MPDGTVEVGTGGRPAEQSPPPAAMLGSPPGAGRRIRRPRRWIAAGAVLVAAAVVVLVVRPWGHPGGDPGGRVLTSLRTTATAVLPAGTTVSWQRVHPAVWTTSGCDGSVGWIPVRVSISFDVPPGVTDPAAVLTRAGSVLEARGWTALPGPSARARGATGGATGGAFGSWAKRSGSATGRGALLSLTQKDPAVNPRWWVLDAIAPVAGPLAATC